MAEAVPLARYGELIPAGALRALAGGEWSARVLPGGRRVNLCLALEDPQGHGAVLRVHRGPALPGARIAREIACHRRAAAAGLAPAIRAADADEGWIVMDRVDATHWTMTCLEDALAMARLADRLRQLHSLDPPEFAPLDEIGLLRANCDVLSAHGEPSAPLMEEGRRLAEGLAALPGRPPVICHGDPDLANFLGPAPVMVDFEYAQIADPTYDLALLLAYYPGLAREREALMRAMGLDDELSRERLPLQVQLCRVVGEAWARAQRRLA